MTLCFLTLCALVGSEKVFNKLLFIKEIFKSVQKLFMFFMKVVLKTKYPPQNLGSSEPRFGHLIQLFKGKMHLVMSE